MFDYEIIATLGPSSKEKQQWLAMLNSGVTAFRLNTSHLTLNEVLFWVEKYLSFLDETQQKPPLYLDLQGSKWRLGEFSSTELRVEQKVILVNEPVSEKIGVLPVPHADFFKAILQSNGELNLADGKVCLQVESVNDQEVHAYVTREGMISSRKGITIPYCSYRKEELSEKDRIILSVTKDTPNVRYAISYIRDAYEMQKYRAALGHFAYLSAKLERATALEEDLHISEQADELWLCRGDLGAEVGIKAMAELVHRFNTFLPQLNKPVILAGQVFEHLVDHSTPTRSEVCCCYEALMSGYKGFVLSDETAVGSFVIEACQAAAIFKPQLAQMPKP